MIKKDIIISGLIAIGIILFTGWISFYTFAPLQYVPLFWEFCFWFHAIPFGIGYVGGSMMSFAVYYIFLWVILTGFVFGIINRIRRLID